MLPDKLRRKPITSLSVRECLGIKPPVSLPVRQSTIKAYEKCPTYGLLSARCGLRPLKRSPALTVGIFAHAALRRFLTWKTDPHTKTQIAKGKTTPFKMRLQFSYQLMGAMYAAQAEELKRYNSLTPENQNTLTQDMNLGLACAARLYKELRPLIKSGAITIVECELPFEGEILVLGRRVAVQGRIDLAVRTDQGDVYLWDTKTTGEKPVEAAGTYMYAIQPWLYTHAARQLPSLIKVLGSKTRGFFHGAIAKPTCRRKGLTKGGAKEQPLEDYLAECEEWWDGRGRWKKRETDRLASPPVYCHKQDIPIDMPYKIGKRILNVQEWLDQPADLLLHPQHDGQCRIGNMICSMQPLCREPYQKWARIAQRQFTTEANPLDIE